MIGIIINAIVFVAVAVGGAVMMCFSLSDIWNYLMAVIPTLISLILVISNYVVSNKRKRYLEVLPKMLSLLNFLRFVVADHTRVKFARERSGWAPLPTLAQTIKENLDKCESIIQEFSKVFRINYNDLYKMLLEERDKVRKICNEKITKLKLTDSEMHLLESKTNKHNH